MATYVCAECDKPIREDEMYELGGKTYCFFCFKPYPQDRNRIVIKIQVNDTTVYGTYEVDVPDEQVTATARKLLGRLYRGLKHQDILTDVAKGPKIYKCDSCYQLINPGQQEYDMEELQVYCPRCWEKKGLMKNG